MRRARPGDPCCRPGGLSDDHEVCDPRQLEETLVAHLRCVGFQDVTTVKGTRYVTDAGDHCLKAASTSTRPWRQGREHAALTGPGDNPQARTAAVTGSEDLASAQSGIQRITPIPAHMEGRACSPVWPRRSGGYVRPAGAPRPWWLGRGMACGEVDARIAAADAPGPARAPEAHPPFAAMAPYTARRGQRQSCPGAPRRQPENRGQQNACLLPLSEYGPAPS
jgi:hypothetical protein